MYTFCSLEFLERHPELLDESISKWWQLPFLQLTKQNKGWATWEGLFDRIGSPNKPPEYCRFDNYVYLLEAAAAGRGLAIGWRGLIERHIDQGSLTLLGSGFILMNNALNAFLTPSGQNKPAARECLKYLTTEPEQ